MSNMVKKRYISPAIIFLLSSLICACSTHQVRKIPPVPITKSTDFGSRPNLSDVEGIFRLNDQQLAEFMDFYNSHGNHRFKPNKRIYRYLQKYVKNYNYFNETLTAEQSISLERGNCLSLAILTTALANIVNVDVGYQLVESAPVYQKEGDVILSSQHVRSILFKPKIPEVEGFFTVGRGGMIIDYFSSANSQVTRSVDNNEFFAMYYRNLAADSIIKKNFNLAYWQLIEALELYPTDEHAINMMAVVHENKGLLVKADSIYRHGIKYSNEKLDLLRNYHNFLIKQHRLVDAAAIQKQLAAINVVNPFDWINLGHTAFSEDNFSEAKRYYKKALKIAPYLHQGHLGVAKSEFRLGNFDASKTSLKLAKKNAFDIETKELYELKMQTLTQL